MEKMTNVKALAYVLENCILPAEIEEKLTALQTSLANKSAGNKKPTAKQNENEVIKTTIVCNMIPNTQYSISEIANTILGGEYTTQKVSALMTQLVKTGGVTKSYKKQKPYFMVEAEAEEGAEEEG